MLKDIKRSDFIMTLLDKELKDLRKIIYNHSGIKGINRLDKLIKSCGIDVYTGLIAHMTNDTNYMDIFINKYGFEAFTTLISITYYIRLQQE
jgi:hypothetical protein